MEPDFSTKKLSKIPLQCPEQSGITSTSPTVCSNCQQYGKTFSVAIEIQAGEEKRPACVSCHKIGEHPPYDPPTPSRLISLIEPDRELFLKGRQVKIGGLG